MGRASMQTSVAIAGLCGLAILAGDARAQPSAGGSGLPAAAAMPAISPSGAGAFVENLGQWPEDVHFLARLPSRVVRAECSGLGLQFESVSQAGGVLLRLTFEGASSAGPRGVDLLEAKHSFFLGNDPTRWHSGARAFRELRYDGLYPGIDLVLRQTDSGLKYDLLVAPSADLERVVLRCEGMEALDDRDAEQFSLHAALGSLIQAPAVSWQIQSDGSVKPATAKWVQRAPGRIGIEVADRDATLPLVIDPELLWSTYLGGTSGDGFSGIGWDALGNVYATGTTAGFGFPQTPGTYQHDSGTGDLAFVVKFRGSDGALLYSSLFGGGPGEVSPWALAVQPSGIATITGRTQGLTFPTTPGAYDTVRVPSNYPTGYVTQLSVDGTSLRFSTFLEGSVTGSYPYDVAVDSLGRVYVVGGAAGSDFPTTPGAFQTTFHGTQTEGFVSRLSADGSALEASTFLGGTSWDGVDRVAFGEQGQVVLYGRTASSDLPTTPGAFQQGLPSWVDATAFVAQMDTDLSQMLWCTYIRPTVYAPYSEYPYLGGLGIDAEGAVYVAGAINTRSWPTTPGAYQTTPPAPGTSGEPSYTGFVSKLSADGSQLLSSSYLAGPDSGGAGSFSLDPSGVITMLAGGFPDFPTTPGAYDTTLSGSYDVAIVRMSPDLDRLFYSTYLGGPGTDGIVDLGANAEGRVTVGGYTYAPGGFPITPNAYQPNFGGGVIDGIITTLDLYLLGIAPFGRASPSCLGPLTANSTVMPAAGASTFSLYCSAAPPNAQGWLVFGSASSIPRRLAGADIWLDIHSSLMRIPATTDGSGFAENVIPLPAGSSGRRVSAQYVFLNNAACPGQGRLCASNALTITVQ